MFLLAINLGDSFVTYFVAILMPRGYIRTLSDLHLASEVTQLCYRTQAPQRHMTKRPLASYTLEPLLTYDLTG